MMTEKFQAIYVWAQARDNQSQDDFYEITPENVGQMSDLSRIQAIVSEMGELNTQHNRHIFAAILQKFNPALKNAARHNNKILLTFSSPDKDVANRQSNMDILLNIQNVNQENWQDYAQYCFKGLTEFCQQTQRQAHILNAENFDEVLQEIFKEIGIFRQPAREQSHKPSRKQPNIPALIIGLIVLFVVGIVGKLLSKN